EVRRSFDWVRFAPPGTVQKYAVRASLPGITGVPGTTLSISLELLENPRNPEMSDSVYNNEMGCLDWGRLSGPLMLRNWRSGDQYQPSESAGERKIKTLCQEFRIPQWERPGWPVLADDEGIVWTRRFGPASRVAANAGSKRVLRVQELSPVREN